GVRRKHSPMHRTSMTRLEERRTMTTMTRWLVLVAAATGLTIFATREARARIIPALSFDGYSLASHPQSLTIGYEFSVNQTITVSSLAYFAPGVLDDHEVGLWDSQGNLLASTTVTTGDIQIGREFPLQSDRRPAIGGRSNLRCRRSRAR